MDQFLGRVVAGLDLMSGDFAILPPFFAHSNEADRAFILQSKSSVDVDTLFLSCFDVFQNTRVSFHDSIQTTDMS